MGRLRDAHAGQDTTEFPLVIFAGAGASAHLGFPVGSELTQRVERTAAQDGGPATAFWERYLKGTTVPDPFSGQRRPGFEDMLEECTCLSESLWAASPQSRTGKCASCGELAGARQLAELIRRELVKAFADPEPSALRESPWISLLDQVFAGLEGGGRAASPVPLFTTNYDTAFASLQDGRGIQVTASHP